MAQTTPAPRKERMAAGPVNSRAVLARRKMPAPIMVPTPMVRASQNPSSLRSFFSAMTSSFDCNYKLVRPDHNEGERPNLPREQLAIALAIVKERRIRHNGKYSKKCIDELSEGMVSGDDDRVEDMCAEVCGWVGHGVVGGGVCR